MRKTDKLYYESAYMADFHAQIIDTKSSNEEFHVALAATCFYPAGGGQPADTGLLDGKPVTAVYQENGLIYHVIASEIDDAGEGVIGQIDWKRRYAFMQNHTGEHILSGLAKTHFGATNVGFHMSERGFTIDFDVMLSKEDIDKLEQMANEVVTAFTQVHLFTMTGKDAENIDFRSKKTFADDETVRMVDVDGHDLCACAALHVAEAREIGIIKVSGYQKYKGGVRLTAYCGTDALWDYARKNDICRDAGALLSADTVSIIPALDKLIKDKAKLQKQIGFMQNKIFELKAEGVAKVSGFAYFIEDGVEVQDLRRFAGLTAERARLAVALSEQGDSHKYSICCDDETRLVNFVNEFNLALDGKGNVAGHMASGAVKAGREKIVAYCEGKYEEN